MSNELPNPPKFGPQNPAPRTPAEWVDFWRWLVSLWRVAKAAINAPQSITIAPYRPGGASVEQILAAAFAFQHQQSQSSAGPRESSPPPQISSPPARASSPPAATPIPPSRFDPLNALTVPGVAVPLRSRPVPPVIEDTRANRTNYPASAYYGFLYYETDSTLLYLSDGTDWIYIEGTYTRTQAQAATLIALLTAQDVGMRIYVSDFNHVLWCTAAATTGWAPGEEGSGKIQGHLIDPTGSGWHLCDGTAAVPYLKSDGSTDTQDLPDLISAAPDAAYLKFGSPASATVNAATAPTFTGSGATTGAVNSGTVSGAVGIGALT